VLGILLLIIILEMCILIIINLYIGCIYIYL
jgi:hypothetical protein